MDRHELLWASLSLLTLRVWSTWTWLCRAWSTTFLRLAIRGTLRWWVFAMILGRLEYFTVLVLFFFRFFLASIKLTKIRIIKTAYGLSIWTNKRTLFISTRRESQCCLLLLRMLLVRCNTFWCCVLCLKFLQDYRWGTKDGSGVVSCICFQLGGCY